MDEPKNTIPALNLANHILNLLKKESGEFYNEETELSENVDKFNTFFSVLCTKIINDDEDSALSEIDESNMTPVTPTSSMLQTLKQACSILFQIQKYASSEKMDRNPVWLVKLLKCCKSQHISVSLISTEIFLNFILKKNIAVGSPYYQIKSIIYCGQKDKAVVEFTGYLDSLQDKKHDNHNEHCHKIILRLWSFLENEQCNEETVNLLQKFDVHLPEILSDVVSKDLTSKTIDQRVKSINKFSTYWTLTADKYPSYIAFPDGNSLFKMLEYLEDDIPSIRLASKSWLSLSTNHFRRILDPLLSILCNPQTDVVTTLQDEMFFTDVYDSRQIVNAFSKFRSIVLNSQNELIEYSMSNKVTDIVITKFREVFKYAELDNETYYNLFIHISVKFIVGQLKNEQVSRFSSDTHSVNATACEFLELILKSSKDTARASEVGHEIISRILKALSTSIEKKDNAMQVQLLNLIKVILFECNFRQDFEKCRMLLSSNIFSDILVSGMKNQVSYVRQHFVEFVIAIVPMITEMLSEEESIIPIKKLVLCLINILRKVDLSMYGEDSEGIVFKKTQNGNAEHKIRATVLIKKQDQNKAYYNNQENLVINSELDISHIIEGIKSIIYHCLQIDPHVSSYQFNEEYEYMDSGGFSIKSIFGGGEDHDKLVDKSLKLNPLKEAVLECMRPFLISSIYCWTDLSIFLPKDYLFSRVGVISYREEDEMLTNAMIENKFPSPEEVEEGKEMTRMKKHKSRKIKKKQDPEQEANNEMQQINGTLEQYIKSESNFTHNLIINFLKPIAFCYPNQVINEVLTIWLKKEDILNNNVNLLLIKLIQLLSCLELPMYSIIGSLNYSIEKFGFQSKKIAQKKKVTLDMIECKVESLIFFFLYTYTLHNLQYYFRTEDTVKLYNLLYKFLKYFQYSRHPTTICWMLDVLYIISSKFSPKSAYKSVKKIKKEYQDIMQILTENAARIVSNDLNIDFAQDYLLDFVYPPSVYEHLRAWTVLIPMADKEVNESAINTFLGSYIHTVRDNMISYDAVHKISRETVLMNELLKEDQRLVKSMTSDNIVKFICDLIKSQIYDKHMRLPPIFLETFFCYYTVQTLKNLFFPLLHNVFLSSSQEKIVYNLDTIVGVITILLFFVLPFIIK